MWDITVPAKYQDTITLCASNNQNTQEERPLFLGGQREGGQSARERGGDKKTNSSYEREREREREMGLGLEPGTSEGDINRGGKGEEGDSHGELTELLQLPYALAQKRGRRERGGRKRKISFV